VTRNFAEREPKPNVLSDGPALAGETYRELNIDSVAIAECSI